MSYLNCILYFIDVECVVRGSYNMSTYKSLRYVHYSKIVDFSDEVRTYSGIDSVGVMVGILAEFYDRTGIELYMSMGWSGHNPSLSVYYGTSEVENDMRVLMNYVIFGKVHGVMDSALCLTSAICIDKLRSILDGVDIRGYVLLRELYRLFMGYGVVGRVLGHMKDCYFGDDGSERSESGSKRLYMRLSLSPGVLLAIRDDCFSRLMYKARYDQYGKDGFKYSLSCSSIEELRDYLVVAGNI